LPTAIDPGHADHSGGTPCPPGTTQHQSTHAASIFLCPQDGLKSDVRSSFPMSFPIPLSQPHSLPTYFVSSASPWNWRDLMH
jgi:hypothetical protein